jgi:hypothetical protein
MGLFLLILFGWFAHGQRSCLPSFTALQTFETAHEFKHGLSSRNSQGDFLTHVIFEGTRTENELRLRVGFDPAWEGVSLPYNLYAVMVIANGESVAWLDFTNGCQGPGISFFPGRTLDLPVVKLLGVSGQKLQIMVWGKL